ncbi:DUF1449 family protein [Alteromonas sp. 345S023]|uniref:DUF1449 family protein n=1 Tax=Alteromonas profundi TaxID=2696062 RepID=A0A7X5LM70_9ALTE|nr:OB-fold-containig protein [Alteromonas profundi]NDV91903.1 DUF1449 family protein [Alteromonas profundi]
MLDTLLSDANYWFSVAFISVVILFVLELSFLLFGRSVLGLLDAPAATTQHSQDTGFLSLFSWLNEEKAPLLVWLICFLFLFGSLGLTLNAATTSLLQFTLPPWISLTFATVFGMITTAKLIGGIANVLTKFQSCRHLNEEFIGAVAHITIGRASRGNPAEAKFTDNYAQLHYVLVEPREERELFDHGERVILVERTPHSWLATRYQ